MSSLRSIANEYHSAANKIAARAERKERNLTQNESKAITFYRISAEKVEALIRPEDSEVEAVWHLEGQERQFVASHKKVSSADKAATPQELIEKAS
jgi:glucose-6-phosphate-specific signal transduction histidine kinase